MADIIQIRRDTAALWTTHNPILAAGEFGYENDTAKIKIGDGTTTWTSLGYYVIEGVTSTAAELNILDGVTSTTAELNKLDGVTVTTAELNSVTAKSPIASPTFTGAVNASGTLQLAGTTITSTAAELNILDGVTADTAELNILDGVTATAAELNYSDGVTSNIQTQFSSLSTPTLEATATGAITAGKPCKINSDGTVSQISHTALAIANVKLKAYEEGHWDSKPFTRDEPYANPFAIQGPGVCYDPHKNQFVVIGWDNNIKCYVTCVGQIKYGTVLWQQPYKILESEMDDSGYAVQNTNSKAMWYDESFDRLVFLDSSGNMCTGYPQEDGAYYWGHRAANQNQFPANHYYNAEYYDGEGIVLKLWGDDLEIECSTITQDYKYNAANGYPARTVRAHRVHQNNQPQWGADSSATMAKIDRTNGEVCVAGTKGTTTQTWQVYLVDLDPAGDKSQDPSTLYDSWQTSGESTAGEKDYLNVTYISPKKYLLTYQNSSNKAAAQVLTFSGSTPTYHTAVQFDTQDTYNTWTTVLKDGRIFVTWYNHGAFLTIDGSNDITVGTIVDYAGKVDYGVLSNVGKNWDYSPVSDVALLFNYQGIGETRGFSTSTAHSDTYIGIAQSTVANAATVTLDIAGGVNSQQSNLTIGKKYYVHHDGNIGTEKSDVYAGMSTSATKLLVKG